MDTWFDLTRTAEDRFGVVTRQELLGAGLADRTIDDWARRGRLVPMARSVFRIGGVPPSFAAEVWAAVLVFGEHTWASHLTLARLLGVPVWGRERRIEVTRPVELSAQRSIACVHRSTWLPPHHLTTWHGLPVTTASRMAFDLARTLGPKALERVIDHLLRHGLATMTSLYCVLYELGGRGRPGTRRMRQVLEALGRDHVPPESGLEAVGMALLADLGFAWQVPISDEQGYIRRVDGLHRDAALVVELDGPHHLREPQLSHDRHADRRLRALGLEVVRLDWDDVTGRGEATRAEVVARLARSAA